MRLNGRVAVPVFLLLCLTPVTVLAQGRAPSVEPISPGGADQPTVTSACPTFSWAPGDGVAAYELGVFELDAARQPRSAPLLHVALSGRASSWTPPATQCFATGKEFAWFLREVKRSGDQPGRWSSGLTFSVATPGSVGANGVAAQNQGNGNGNGSDNGGGNQAILDQLDVITTKLETLMNPNPLSKELCLELGAELEVGLDGEVKLAGGADGSAGAKAFANGVKAWLKANGELKLAGGLKGAGAVKHAWCWDRSDPPPAATGAVTSASTAPRSASASLTPLTDVEFTARLLALADELQLGEERLRAVMDLLPTFTVATDPWSSLRSTSPIAGLADVLPMPAAMRTTMRDPGQIIADFRAQLDLCSQSNLPPAISGIVSEFCALAANERFSQLLDRVDGVVQNVKTGVDGTRTVVNNINGSVNSLRNKVDDFYCKFFCSSNQ